MEGLGHMRWQTAHWLTVSELDQMAARLSYDREISDAATKVSWAFYKSALGLRLRGQGSDLFACLALKPKVIERLLDGAFMKHHDELGLVVRCHRRTDPHSVAAFGPAIPHYRQPAAFDEERNGPR